MQDATAVCAPVCQPDAENVTKASVPDAAAMVTGGGTGDDFAAAMMMIASLPLTPAEKAEAVRRLLAGNGADGQP
jgi:hypothetical protein